jgi:glycosyl transferase family 25
VFVINLDRRKDRLMYMAAQLQDIGLDWERVSAHDMQLVDDAFLAGEISMQGQIIGMGRGSQCCALTNFDIYRRIVAEDIPAALILQDDVELSPKIASFLETLDWLPKGIDLVQFEKYGRRASRRLLGPALGVMPVDGAHLHRLFSRTAGAACYLITKQGAARILADKPLLNMPIDHFLFSPNVSPLFDRLNVAVVSPALARQNEDEFGSDLDSERQKRRKDLAVRLRRLWREINRIPHQLVAMTKGARWHDFNYQDRDQ